MIEDESAPYDMSIHSNSSALAWTKFFREHNPECNLDDDVMLGWFANAMMAMHDHIYQTTQPEQTEQKPLSDEERQRLSKAYSAKAEQVAFEEGIIFAEISYGIGGGNEH